MFGCHSADVQRAQNSMTVTTAAASRPAQRARQRRTRTLSRGPARACHLSPSPPECDIPNCKTCNNQARRCDVCEDAFYESNGECISCDSHCERCNGAECVRCINSWYPVRGKCMECTTLSNCAECDNTKAYCTECVDASFALTNGACTACTVSNCVECPTDAGLCERCQQGYYFVSATDCQKCDDSCPDCSRDDGACEFCPVGKYIDGKRCIACPSECTACSSASQCSECAGGFYRSDEQCKRLLPQH